MTDIRIVCTHDAVSFAERLTRLLAAEEHTVRLCCGRHSLNELEAAQSMREAVILIWSYDAPSQHYMLEWMHGTDPARLAEIARAPGAPKGGKRAPVIDFSDWRGERGSPAWEALTERLRVISRVIEPPRPAPKRGVVAMGLMSAAAVGGAVFLRANEPQHVQTVASVAPESVAPAAVATPTVELGGPDEIDVSEPASGEEFMASSIGPRRGPLELTSAHALPPIAEVQEFDLRGPSLVERLSTLNPLRLARLQASRDPG